MPCVVYSIAGPKGRVYVGSTIDQKRRWPEHRKRLRGNRHENPYLQNAWNKYGEASFQFGVLEVVSSTESLAEREQFWLEAFGDEVFNVGECADCPSRGVTRSSEARKRMSDAHIGHVLSADTKRKIGEAQSRYLGAHPNCSFLVHRAQGERHGQSKLTNSEVTSIRRLYATGSITQADLGDRFCVHQATISKIVNGKLRRNGSAMVH